MVVYFNGTFLEKSAVHISPDDRGYYFADGIYEVARWYGDYFFAMQEHLERMQRSLREIRVQFDKVPDVAGIANELIRRNKLEGQPALLYLQVTRGTAKRVHTFPNPPVEPNIYIAANPFTPSWEEQESGMAVITLPDERWGRCDIKTIGLLPNVLAKQRAKEEGAQEAILVRNGLITEASHSNVFAVKAGKLLTHPDSPFILPGVSRRIVLALAGELGLPLVLDPIRVEDIFRIDELFITNTSGEVVPVVEINHMKLASGKMGPVTASIRDAFVAYREKRKS